MARSRNFQVPFDAQGNLVTHHSRYHYGTYNQAKVALVDNFEFEDELEITYIGRTRYSTRIELKSRTTGAKYTMFGRDLPKVLANFTVEKNVIKGAQRWTFCRHGSKFAVTPVAGSTVLSREMLLKQIADKLGK